MTPVPNAHTHARTIPGTNGAGGGGREYLVSPNRCGKGHADEPRGALRIGIVDENEDTEESGLDGLLAAVTHEEDGEVRFYVWEPVQGDVIVWVGPHWAHSEEILPMETT